MRHTVHLILARKPNLILINKKKRTCHQVDFAIPADHRIKIKQNEKQKDRQISGRELNTVIHESDSDTNCCWCTWNSLQRLGKKTSGTENQRKNEDCPNYSTVKIS